MYLDCLSEVCVSYPPPRLPNGLPDNHLTCKSGNPVCDTVPGDDACTFAFQICFNLINKETRFQCRIQGPVSAVNLHAPNQAKPKDFNIPNVAAFETALINLGGAVSAFKGRSISYVPPLLGDTVCTAPIPWTVPLLKNNQTGALRRRKVRVNWHTYGSTRGFDGDHLYLRCDP